MFDTTTLIAGPSFGQPSHYNYPANKTCRLRSFIASRRFLKECLRDWDTGIALAVQLSYRTSHANKSAIVVSFAVNSCKFVHHTRHPSNSWKSPVEQTSSEHLLLPLLPSPVPFTAAHVPQKQVMYYIAVCTYSSSTHAHRISYIVFEWLMSKGRPTPYWVSLRPRYMYVFHALYGTHGTHCRRSVCHVTPSSRLRSSHALTPFTATHAHSTSFLQLWSTICTYCSAITSYT